MNLAWVPHVLSIELKKAFSYRVVFWLKFFLGTGAELSVACFVWYAMFRSADTTTIQGFSFAGLVVYTLFASFSSKITRGADYGYIAQDIYDGSLNRYLLYPLPFFPYKYVTHLTQQLLGVAQLLIAMPLLYLAIGSPDTGGLTTGSFLTGIFTCLIAGYLYFVMSSCLELVAFWQDIIWNLMVMLKFCISLLGGALIPLSFYPEWGQRIVHYTPFPSMVYFPVRTFLGQVSLEEWLQNAGLLAAWSLFFTILLSWIWNRGVKQYSGVGI